MIHSRRILIILPVFILAILLLYPESLINSANLTTTKDTLQSSRMSLRARVDTTGTSVGGSQIRLKSSGSDPSNTISTANLKVGDTAYGQSGTYTVTDILNSTDFTVNPVVVAGDADDNDPIVLKMKPQHTITFNTVSTLANGYFKILIPAASSNSNDGTPDSSGWDFSGGSVSVGATSTASGFTFVTGVATASGGSGCTSPANYHCFEVHYSGVGNTNAPISITIGNTNGTNTPLAPAPSATHTEASADTYTFQAIHYNSSNTAIDQTNGKIAVIEAVRVSVTVDPTITFSLTGVGTGVTPCGTAPDIATDTGTNAPLSVPFGTMSLNTFKRAAHLLTVSTNATNGYSVTAIENNELSKDGLGVTKISDTTCDSACLFNSTGSGWTTATNNGFGYSIQNLSATGVDNDNSYTGTPNYREFANNDSAQAATKIFYGSTVANAQQAYVCYKISVGATQAAGDYENQITYTATASF